MSRELNPGVGEIFRTRPDRLWSSPSVIYNGYRVFPGGKTEGRGVDHPHPSSAEPKEQESYTATRPLGLRGLLYGDLYFKILHVKTQSLPQYV